MIRLIIAVFATAILLFAQTPISQAQVENKRDIKDTTTYDVVIKHDGTVYQGKIISNDAREVLIETESVGQIYIPKHDIKEIKKVKGSEIGWEGDYIPEEVFATRYFISTNGLPIKKRESYIQWSWFGPDLQFGISDNFGVGLMTSWVGIPIIGTAKYSIPVSENFNLGVGSLIGTGSWAAPEFFMALPFGAATFGTRRSNLSISAGYGFVANDGLGEGRALVSVGAMTKIAPKMSLVFDSVIVPSTGNSRGVALFIPGFRWQSNKKIAFQFGFAGLSFDGELVPLPIPMIQLFSLMN